MVQRTRIIKTSNKLTSEGSAYWSWVHNSNAHKQKDGREDWEPVIANPDGLSEEEGLTPHSAPMTQETADTIREALELLSPRQREAVDLLIEGKSFDEAARKMRVKKGTFQIFVRRARKIVQEHVIREGLLGI